MTESDKQILMDGISQIGLSTDEVPVEKLHRYIDELALWNRQLGLVSADGKELIIRHILDSLVAVGAVQAEVRRLAAAHNGTVVVADLGSGAGLPGIPIACFETDASWVLIERSGRRTGFLRNAIAAARLENVSVVDRDLSQTPVQFHLALMRAFRPLTPSVIREVRSHIVAPGTMFAMKGKRKKIEDEIAGLVALGSDSALSPRGATTPAADEIDVLPLRVPFLDEERHIVRLRFA